MKRLIALCLFALFAPALFAQQTDSALAGQCPESTANPNEILMPDGRLNEGHGVFYNCSNFLYESADASIQATSPCAVLQYVDRAFYSGESWCYFIPADDWYWARQPKALQRLRASVTWDYQERGRLAFALQRQGLEIDWPIHVMAISPASIMWQREKHLNDKLTDIFGRPITLPYVAIPKDLPFPGVTKGPRPAPVTTTPVTTTPVTKPPFGPLSARALESAPAFRALTAADIPDSAAAADLASPLPLMGGLKLEVAVSSGIPEAVAATMKYATVVRETTDPETRKEFDKLNLWIAQQFWGLFGYRPGN